jgi:hypothetical protein
MADTGDNLTGASMQLAEQLKIAVSSPMFRLKWKLKKGLKKMNPFSSLTKGKATKDQTQQYMMQAGAVGSYMIHREKDPNSADPYISNGKTLRNGVMVPNLTQNPFHVNCDPNNVSNY